MIAWPRDDGRPIEIFHGHPVGDPTPWIILDRGCLFVSGDDVRKIAALE